MCLIIINLRPYICTMDYRKSIVSHQKVESISIQRAKSAVYMYMYMNYIFCIAIVFI